ncbi:hypothetical protein Q7C36_012616 [Tachysurus vachellii]|uniref:Uncharacterized protein n=1 Tax=Tachysurus vachellii TaxID=175792 RepID=A0AA88SPV9_TACVA|nr:hypothetical protein Q7C36_012616 [Tachysurus vachellii]
MIHHVGPGTGNLAGGVKSSSQIGFAYLLRVEDSPWTTAKHFIGRRSLVDSERPSLEKRRRKCSLEVGPSSIIQTPLKEEKVKAKQILEQ